MKVLQELTRTVYASFVFLPLESPNILVTIITKKPKRNSFKITVVESTDFPQLEKYYETQQFVMVLKENGTTNTVYLSRALFRPTYT